MTQHKWHKEIKAWAEGAEIQYKSDNIWLDINQPVWNAKSAEYRIKPQFKNTQYLYAYKKSNNEVELDVEFIEKHELDDDYQYIGKIKLEVDDV
jgi:hypothetical protein